MLSPFVRLSVNEPRSDVAVGYSPMFISSIEGGGALNAYHRATFTVSRKLSRSWWWGFSSREGYGDEEARLLADFQAELGALRLTDKEIDARNSMGLTWERTRKQQLSLILGDSYSSLQSERKQQPRVCPNSCGTGDQSPDYAGGLWPGLS